MWTNYNKKIHYVVTKSLWILLNRHSRINYDEDDSCDSATISLEYPYQSDYVLDINELQHRFE